MSDKDMMTEVKGLVSEVGSNVKSLTEKQDAFSDKVINIEKSVSDVTGTVAKHNEVIDTLTERLNRTAQGVEKEGNKVAGEYRKQFFSYLYGATDPRVLKGIEKEYVDFYGEKLASEGKIHEAKALSVGNDAAGGFTVPEELASDIVRKLYDASPIRQLARVSTTSRDALHILQRVDDIGSASLGEGASASETTAMDYDRARIQLKKQHVYLHASEEVLDDSGINLEAEIAFEAADKLARDEGEDFINGTTSPRGFLTHTAGTTWGTIEQVNSGSTSVVDIDTTIDLLYKLDKSAYIQNAAFVMNAQTWGQYVQAEDGASNKLPVNFVDVANMRLLGKPVVICDGMPAIGSDALSVAVADWQKAYRIVDHVAGMKMSRDEITSPGTVKWSFRKRYGGQTVNFDAIKLYKQSA